MNQDIRTKIWEKIRNPGKGKWIIRNETYVSNLASFPLLVVENREMNAVKCLDRIPIETEENIYLCSFISLEIFLNGDLSKKGYGDSKITVRSEINQIFIRVIHSRELFQSLSIQFRTIYILKFLSHPF